MPVGAFVLQGHCPPVTLEHLDLLILSLLCVSGHKAAANAWEADMVTQHAMGRTGGSDTVDIVSPVMLPCPHGTQQQD